MGGISDWISFNTSRRAYKSEEIGSVSVSGCHKHQQGVEEEVPSATDSSGRLVHAFEFLSFSALDRASAAAWTFLCCFPISPADSLTSDSKVICAAWGRTDSLPEIQIVPSHIIKVYHIADDACESCCSCYSSYLSCVAVRHGLLSSQ